MGALYVWPTFPASGSANFETTARAALEQWRASAESLDASVQDAVTALDDVISSAGAVTDNAVARFDGIGGATIQNSLVTVDDSGSVNIPSGQTYNINGSAHTHDIDGLLPDQSGNNGKYLTTDGTNASWGSGGSTDIGLIIALGG